MSASSNDNGRAYEFACMQVFANSIGMYRSVSIDKNSAYYANKRAWNTLNKHIQSMYLLSANAAVEAVFQAEPRMIEADNDMLILRFQTDEEGKKGDVRDLLVIRKEIAWEIGFSIKHNHFAVKHSRLSAKNDFGKVWYGIPCSATYFAAIKPIFDYLKIEHKKETKFDDLPNKWDDVYVPILRAFRDEVNYQNEIHPELASNFAAYLLNRFDFYKVISIDAKRITQLNGYNMYGTLNKSGRDKQPSIDIPIVALPTKITNIDFYLDRKNTLEMTLNNGWSFTLRLHNASTITQASLKFDVQLLGAPASIVTINCIWK